MKCKVFVVMMLPLLLVSMSILGLGIQTIKASPEETVNYKQSHITELVQSYNDTDPVFKEGIHSGEGNLTFSTPDANGVINLTRQSGYSDPQYNPISNLTTHSFCVSDWYGKLYSLNNTGDVDIISMTNDTGTFFWKDESWHPAGEEYLGDGILDPAGSAWFTGMLNTSVYLGNGTDGPLLNSWLQQLWLTTGYSENTVIEPASRLNGCHANTTGIPFSPPYVGSIVTWVYTYAKLNIPFLLGEHLDIQGWTEQLTVLLIRCMELTTQACSLEWRCHLQLE